MHKSLYKYIDSYYFIIQEYREIQTEEIYFFK